MNRSEIRELARSITELESDDVADEILNLYISDGYQRIIALERRWPFFEETTTTATVAGDRTIGVASLASGTIREVDSIVNKSAGGVRLKFLDYDVAEAVWVAGDNIVDSIPLFWSLWNETIHFWPRPDAVYTLVVRGHRKPTAWDDDDVTEVDADDRLHRSLVYYCISQMYQLQEDVELATFYRQSFDEAVQLARADIMRVSSVRPLILSVGNGLVRDRGPQRGGDVWVT